MIFVRCRHQTWLLAVNPSPMERRLWLLTAAVQLAGMEFAVSLVLPTRARYGYIVRITFYPTHSTCAVLLLCRTLRTVTKFQIFCTGILLSIPSYHAVCLSDFWNSPAFILVDFIHCGLQYFLFFLVWFAFRELSWLFVSFCRAMLRRARQNRTICRLFVSPSVCDVQVLWSHRLKYFENN